MIELGTKPHCDNCRYFEPIKFSSVYRTDDNKTLISNTKVLCKNYEKCLEIEKYISGYFGVEVNGK